MQFRLAAVLGGLAAIAAGAATLFAEKAAPAAPAGVVTVYKSPTCGCCGACCGCCGCCGRLRSCDRTVQAMNNVSATESEMVRFMVRLLFPFLKNRIYITATDSACIPFRLS